MSDIKKYYYLKLKDNFFDSDAMMLLESMQDGYVYSNILLKLYLRSLRNDGKLMFNDRIPFNSTMLASVTRHSIGDIEKAVNIFKDLGLIEVLDNGAIYMSDIQNFIGHSSSEADRKRIYRSKIENEKTKIGQMSDKCPDKSPPEIEIEKERETEKKLLPPLDSYSKAWNELAEVYKLQKILKLTDKRKTKLKKRISETTDFVAVFNNCMKKIATSEFLKGNNNRGWKIDFDFIIENDTNYVNILEGKYDGK